MQRLLGFLQLSPWSPRVKFNPSLHNYKWTILMEVIDVTRGHLGRSKEAKHLSNWQSAIKHIDEGLLVNYFTLVKWNLSHVA
jgi:hypothetical protein